MSGSAVKVDTATSAVLPVLTLIFKLEFKVAEDPPLVKPWPNKIIVTVDPADEAEIGATLQPQDPGLNGDPVHVPYSVIYSVGVRLVRLKLIPWVFD